MSEHATTESTAQRGARASTHRRVAVIGGGVTGLAATHRLLELDPEIDVTLFEASDRLGGVIRTERAGDYLLEYSADNFVTNTPWGVDLCRRLGIADKLLHTNAEFRRALIARGDRLLPAPRGWAIMTPGSATSVLSTPLLSWKGKMRVLAERFIPPANNSGDESVASFGRRRLGKEAFERLVQPLLAGIYTADAEKLSLSATFPQYLEMERTYRSISRGKSKVARQGPALDPSASGARYSLFVAPEEGMGQLIAALEASISRATIRMHANVAGVRRANGAWTVEGTGEAPFDAVIVATSATVAERLLNEVDATLATELGQIPYASSVIAIAAYDRRRVSHPLDAFGFVVPEIERRHLLACSFSSVKFPGRAPAGKILLRAFLGGAARPTAIDDDDERIESIVSEELESWLGTRGRPELFRVVRMRAAMPQYHLGHLERLDRINKRLAQLPGLQLAGSAYRGVGVPHCIHSGEQAAEAVLAVRREQPSHE